MFTLILKKILLTHSYSCPFLASDDCSKTSILRWSVSSVLALPGVQSISLDANGRGPPDYSYVQEEHGISMIPMTPTYYSLFYGRARK